LIIALILGAVAAAPTNATKKTIHLVPHSHDDVGWLKTVDQYYDGTNKNAQFTGVEDTITTVIDALLQNPARRFVQIEMKFFSMWFYTQTEER
jgi:lysosomal alpha-mannosidase